MGILSSKNIFNQTDYYGIVLAKNDISKISFVLSIDGNIGFSDDCSAKLIIYDYDEFNTEINGTIVSSTRGLVEFIVHSPENSGDYFYDMILSCGSGENATVDTFIKKGNLCVM